MISTTLKARVFVPGKVSVFRIYRHRTPLERIRAGIAKMAAASTALLIHEHGIEAEVVDHAGYTLIIARAPDTRTSCAVTARDAKVIPFPACESTPSAMSIA